MNYQHKIESKDLTIIIPLDFNRRGFDLLNRVMLFRKKLGNCSFNIIFGVNSAPNFYFQFFKKMIQNCHNFSYAAELCQQSHLSKLRNIALSKVSTSHVLFLDIDIFPDVQMIDKVIQDLNSSINNLVMYPCLYLSQKGNQLLFKKNAYALTEAYYDYRRDLVKHLAFPSSIIACDIESVNQINGFDEDFTGYAYEDLDFMIRLFYGKKLITYTSELLIDEPYLAPMMSIGFRAMLAEPFLDKILAKNYFVHLFHKKDQKQTYYKAKIENKSLFQTKLKKCIINKDEPIIHHYRLIQHIEKFKKNNSDYSVLWAEIKGHLFR